MSRRNLALLMLFALGETLIISGFIYFGVNIPENILLLNIIVSSIVYGLLFIDSAFQWISFNDELQKAIGSIGIKWFSISLYIIAAIVVMIFFNTIYPLSFSKQLLIQCILLFLLFYGLYQSVSASDKVRGVYIEEKKIRSGIEQMKSVTKSLQLKLDAMKNVPPNIIFNISEIQDNLRFLSPCNSNLCHELEKQFMSEMRELDNCFFEVPLNLEKIDDCLKNCQRTYIERKQALSN